MGIHLLSTDIIYILAHVSTSRRMKCRKVKQKTARDVWPRLRLAHLRWMNQRSHFCRISLNSMRHGRNATYEPGLTYAELGFCTLCFCFTTKMLHLNAPFFPLKCSDNAHYTERAFILFCFNRVLSLTKTCKWYNWLLLSLHSAVLGWHLKLCGISNLSLHFLKS